MPPRISAFCAGRHVFSSLSRIAYEMLASGAEFPAFCHLGVLVRHRANLSVLVFVFAVSLLVVSARALAQADPDPDPASGEDLYRRYCSSCHGIDAKGDGPVAAVLTHKPKDLTRIAERRGGVFPTAELVRIVDGRDVAMAHGTREMPVWGKRFGEALQPGTSAETVRRGTAQLIVDYLASLQLKQAAPPKK